MASKDAQRKWRSKHRFTKTQLNVMVRRLVHRDLEETAQKFRLRGKAEAVSFSSFVTKGLEQAADNDPELARLLENLRTAYERDRDIYK